MFTAESLSEFTSFSLNNHEFCSKNSIDGVDVSGYPESALFHARRSNSFDDFDSEEKVLNDIVLEVLFFI